MDFSAKKLPPDAASRLRLCPIATVKPYALMLAPVYVYMKRNEKFVSVKAPLDFFTPQELERLRPFESFYLHEFVDQAMLFRQAGRQALALLKWEPKAPAAAQSPFPEVPLPPAPYELSDAMLRITGPLWVPASSGATIEPFFTAVFANELCETLPEELLRTARDSDVQKYELAVFRSSWAVFLALHLGYCELAFLNRLRRRVFEQTLDGTISQRGERSEIDDLVFLSANSLASPQVKALLGDTLVAQASRISQKLAARIERARAQFHMQGQVPPSIHGPGGFAEGGDV